MRNKYKNAIMAVLLCWNKRLTQIHLVYAIGKKALPYFIIIPHIRMTINLRDTREGRIQTTPFSQTDTFKLSVWIAGIFFAV